MIANTAIFSPCQKYRYLLTRNFFYPTQTSKRMVVVGLNPSTATADTDDPTIRRCIGFAKRERCDGLSMLNLFAYRSTDPEKLGNVPDPRGPENTEYLYKEFSRPNAIIVLAFGSHWLAVMLSRNILSQNENSKVQFKCLGTTMNGWPRHPLYVKADQPLLDWTFPNVESKVDSKPKRKSKPEFTL